VTPVRSFIETQFPISRLSQESYKERKGSFSQTLTGLGKWWGRKPLILVRAAILGSLIPASDNPKRDREIFLNLLTMDDEGLLRRRTKKCTLAELIGRMTTLEKAEYDAWIRRVAEEADHEKKKALKAKQSEWLESMQDEVFLRLPYDEKLTYCDRPERIGGPSGKAWAKINAYLGTNGGSLSEFVEQLGQKQFSRTPRVGDAFCGGGSIPFEAARIGCVAYGSDLNPVAALLTWAALKIVGGGPEVAATVNEALEEVYSRVDEQITAWGVEHNEAGERTDAYLYCCEVTCPETGWRVPLAPSWVIGEKSPCVAQLVPDRKNKYYKLNIKSDATDEEMTEAKTAGTVKDSCLVHPILREQGKPPTPIRMLRGDRTGVNGANYGLRAWENNDLVPRDDDVFQERLYCIRWVKTWTDDKGKTHTGWRFAAPEPSDFKREEKVLSLLRERLTDWQEKGHLPRMKIEYGDKTDEPIRTRGWTHWHHLFNPRQLLIAGLFSETISRLAPSRPVEVLLMLGVGNCANWNSKLCRWNCRDRTREPKTEQTFYNQALNTLFNWGVRALPSIKANFKIELHSATTSDPGIIQALDARMVNTVSDIWITDPPYADAINYHELSEFFLSWYDRSLLRLFPEWYVDSKRALAVTGNDENFRKNMADCYRNLATHMPDHGVQIVMFTHQDAAVWADLALILWASGMRVTAAWCIATETDSALKEGNYVQGTVLLVLRKRTSEQTAFLDEVYYQVEEEVRQQLQSMLSLEDSYDPNFGDADYQLAAYAAALRVLTQYRQLADFDIARELTKVRAKNEPSPVEAIIRDAVKIACDLLIPKGFSEMLWKTLLPEERFYLKGLEIESHGEHRNGVYQELARGFGIDDYKPLLAKTKANQTRLKTASEFGSRMLDDSSFGSTLLRQVLFAVHETRRTDAAAIGLNWLRNEYKDYWSSRERIQSLLGYFAMLGDNENMPHWKEDSHAARVVAGAVANDHV
jgi:adenine-specific DNA methylase